MSWLREHDGELGDPKVARLSDRHYRDLHALRQWLARERPGPAGLFSEDELELVTYAAGKRARRVTPGALERFIELGLVRELDSYSAGELAEMGAEGMPASSRQAALELSSTHARRTLDARSTHARILRCNKWEAYCAPLDRTRNERQARFRARHEGGEGADVTPLLTPSVTLSARASSRPVPSNPRSAESPQAARAGEPEVGRLFALLDGMTSSQAEYVHGLALRSPAGDVERLVREVGAGVVDPLGYVLERLQRMAA